MSVPHDSRINRAGENRDVFLRDFVISSGLFSWFFQLPNAVHAVDIPVPSVG